MSKQTNFHDWKNRSEGFQGPVLPDDQTHFEQCMSELEGALDGIRTWTQLLYTFAQQEVHCGPKGFRSLARHLLLMGNDLKNIRISTHNAGLRLLRQLEEKDEETDEQVAG